MKSHAKFSWLLILNNEIKNGISIMFAFATVPKYSERETIYLISKINVI